MNSKHILYLNYICIILLISGCKTVNDPDNFHNNNDNVIYFNSFEADSDTAGCEGYGGCFFYDEASPGGGERSLYISGGCIVPHVILPVPAQNDDGYFQLKCWGKNKSIGGSIELFTNRPLSSDHVEIFTSDTSWQYYQTSDSLFCPASYSMNLLLMSGGIIPGGMLVDQIKIIKTD